MEVNDLLSIVPVHCVTVQRFCVNMSFVKNNEENNFTKVFGRHFCDIILLIFFSCLDCLSFARWWFSFFANLPAPSSRGLHSCKA